MHSISNIRCTYNAHSVWKTALFAAMNVVVYRWTIGRVTMPKMAPVVRCVNFVRSEA